MSAGGKGLEFAVKSQFSLSIDLKLYWDSWCIRAIVGGTETCPSPGLPMNSGVPWILTENAQTQVVALQRES